MNGLMRIAVSHDASKPGQSEVSSAARGDGRPTPRAVLVDSLCPGLARGIPACVVLLVAALLFAGCASYKLRGKVIEGTTPGVFVVDRDNERLQTSGVPGAVVALTLDPGRLNAKRVGSDISDMNGTFAVPVGEFGAGVLEYNVRLDARLEDHEPASETLMLPGGDKRVLIVMAPGDGSGKAPKSETFLEETMCMGKPYMNE